MNKNAKLKNPSTCAILSTYAGFDCCTIAAKRALERYTRRRVRQLAPRGADAVFHVNGQRFIVEVKSNARSASVARAVVQLKEARKRIPDAAPLLVIPFMGETGVEICQREGVNWIDLRGNATIDTDAFRIYVRGKDDVVEPQSPSSAVNPFGPMASRVVHAMLLEPNGPWKRMQIETATDLDKGYISRSSTLCSWVEYQRSQSWARARAASERTAGVARCLARALQTASD